MKVLFTDHDMLDVTLEQRIFDEAGIELATAQCRTEDDVIRAGRGCSALLIQYAPITGRVLEALPEVRLCSRIGAGYDTIDARAAERLGVWLANSPDYGVGEVSLHALSMMLALIRNVVRYDRDIHAGTWHYTSAGTIPRAQDLTVGILGLGRIGKRFAHYAQPIFRRVMAHDPNLIDGDFPQYVQRVGLEELFEQADAISIHCLLDDGTRGLVGERLLGRMKAGAYLVNTARGAVVDVDALAAAVAADRLAGVGLDVLPVEPIPAGHPLLADPRVILSPHAAFYSAASELELRRKAALNIVNWARTGRPDYPVVVPVAARQPAG
ncbi:MAG: C-terminal binding protein [Burkholderiaceae bacterium]|nr:C-terminal binding protein [Burkholderiaceae bacterium]